jgi:hypothetical protein
MQPQEPQTSNPESEQNQHTAPIDSQPHESSVSDPPVAASSIGQVFTPGSAAQTPSSSDSQNPDALLPPPTATSGPIMSASSMKNTEESKKRAFKPSKKLALIAAIPVLLVGAGAAAYFGYVVPNKPENLWKTALVNTGKGYDKAASYAESSKLGKGLKLDSTFKFDFGDTKIDGSFNGTSDEKSNGNFKGSVSASGMKLDAEVRTVASSGSNPDLYFKVNGLQGLGQFVGAYLGTGASEEMKQLDTAINSVNNQWYFVDHTLLDQATEKDSSNTSSALSKKDVSDFLNAIGGPSKKYIFTSNPNNMAIEARQNIGREQVDGLSTYHYKIGVNKENLKKWNKEVCDNIKQNKLYKTLNFSQDQAALEKECYDTKDIDSINSSRTADAWVDMKTKLIHKVRFTDSKNASNYVDLIQNYKGGNKLPLAVAFSENLAGESTKGLLNIDYDSAASILKISGSVKINGESGGTGNVEMTIAPNSSEVKIEKPVNPKNVLQLMNDLGLSQRYNTTPDINAPTLQ